MHRDERPLSPLDNPAFRRWFVDSAVRDRRGDPLVVWHGTPKPTDFYVFDFDYAIDLGMHFGSEEAAKEIASKRGSLRPFYLSIKNPLRLEDPGDWITLEGARSADPVPTQLEKLGLIEPDEAETLLDYLAKVPRKWDAGSVAKRVEASRVLRDLIWDLKFDGVVYENLSEDEGSTAWIAFSPYQVKSADQNEGTFSKSDPDVRKNPGRTFIPPARVAAEARYGLELRAAQPPSNRCCTDVGLRRAVQLANRQPVSVDTLKRMRSYFQRHEVDKQGRNWGIDSKGFQAWLLWGGDSGEAWCNRILDELGE